MTGDKNLEMVDEVIAELETLLDKLRARRAEQEAKNGD